MTELPPAFFLDMPKVDIHRHLYGTIREATLREFARAGNAPVSDDEISEFYIRGEKPKGVLAIFRLMEEHVLGHADRLHRLTLECLEDAARENVLYQELFWNPTETLRFNPDLSYADAQAAILDAMSVAQERFGIASNLVPAIDRQASPEDAIAMIEAMVAHPHPQVVGIGIDYLETDHPPEGFWRTYALAREAGYKTTAHAGEFGAHWRNIETALDLLHVDRIDHGYTVLDNPDLLARCIDRGIVFTVVPTNSFYMRTMTAEEWAKKHPIRTMGRAGLRIHPNVDDPTFHNVTPALCWQMMHRDFGYGFEELERFAYNGLDSAWMADDAKAALRSRFEDGFASLRSQYLGAEQA